MRFAPRIMVSFLSEGFALMRSLLSGVKAGAVGNSLIVFHGDTAKPLGLYPDDTIEIHGRTLH